jgi:hypothetical protein
MDLKLRLMGKQASKQAVPKRGTIKGFSPKARKRMIRSVVKMDQEAMGKPLFLTLTYPGEFSDNPLVFKRHLHNFMTELRRRWPAAAIQWRLEPQKRGAPHYHLLIWKGPEHGELFQARDKATGKTRWIFDNKDPVNQEMIGWFKRTWFRVVGSGDAKHLEAGIRIEPIQSLAGIVFYITKYMSKQDEEKKEWGRTWGVYGRKNIDEHPCFKYGISDKSFYGIRRAVRKWLERKTGKKLKTWGRAAGFKLNHLDSVTGLRLLGFFAEQEQKERQSQCPF